MVLPSEALDPADGPPPPHTFLDGDFRPSMPFLELMKQEVAIEMETLWDRHDVTMFPTLSDEWKHHVREAAAAEKERRRNLLLTASPKTGAPSTSNRSPRSPKERVDLQQR